MISKRAHLWEREILHLPAFIWCLYCFVCVWHLLKYFSFLLSVFIVIDTFLIYFIEALYWRGCFTASFLVPVLLKSFHTLLHDAPWSTAQELWCRYIHWFSAPHNQLISILYPFAVFLVLSAFTIKRGFLDKGEATLVCAYKNKI